MNFVRRKVSLNKKRFEKEGFNLDLAYITPQVIAMGFPASGMESWYRNPRPEVKRFFNKKHRGQFKVYNMCSEPARQYSPTVFEHRVSRFPFADHQAPPLEMIGRFCADVQEWLSEDPAHVAAVHCKAGKGRAGMMICCYLIHSGFAPNADEAMTYYAKERTWDNEGVTIPSQRRFVRYYDDVVHHGMPEQPRIKLTAITIQTSRYVDPEHAEPWFEILLRGHEPLYISKPQKPQPSKDLTIEIPKDIWVQGDIKIVFYDHAINEKKEMFHFWFNTAFIENNELILRKQEIDVAWKDKGKNFRPDFEVHVQFEGAEVAAMTKLKQQNPVVVVTQKANTTDNNNSTEAKKSKKNGTSKKNNKGKKKQQETNSDLSESDHEEGTTKQVYVDDVQQQTETTTTPKEGKKKEKKNGKKQPKEAEVVEEKKEEKEEKKEEEQEKEKEKEKEKEEEEKSEEHKEETTTAVEKISPRKEKKKKQKETDGEKIVEAVEEEKEKEQEKEKEEEIEEKAATTGEKKKKGKKNKAAKA